MGLLLMRDAPTLSVDADGEEGGPARVPGLTILGHPDPDRAGERAVLPVRSGMARSTHSTVITFISCAR